MRRVPGPRPLEFGPIGVCVIGAIHCGGDNFETLEPLPMDPRKLHPTSIRANLLAIGHYYDVSVPACCLSSRNEHRPPDSHFLDSSPVTFVDRRDDGIDAPDAWGSTLASPTPAASRACLDPRGQQWSPLPSPSFYFSLVPLRLPARTSPWLIAVRYVNPRNETNRKTAENCRWRCGCCLRMLASHARLAPN